jgi:rod shape-determining protein MreC
MPSPFQDGVGHAVRSTVLYPFVALQRGAADREGRFADVGRLRSERDSLASFLVGQATLASENRQLRQLLGFRERLTYSFVPAEGRWVAGQGSQGLLRLSVGRRDGLRDGAAVITADGLAGQVGQLGSATAMMKAWTHPDFAVSVMTQDGETYGVAHPIQREGIDMLAFSPVAFHTAPDTGALIVTSGEGGTYPQGIPVGRVAGEGKDPGGWQRIYYVRPLVTPGQVSHVLVLGDPVQGASDQNLAAAWGVRLTAPAPADSAARGLSPDAAAPARPAAAAPRPAAPRPAAPRPRPRPVDPTPELPGRPVFPGEPQAAPATQNPGE